MITQLLRALTGWIDRRNARDNEGIAIARRFNLALLCATKLAGDDEAILSEIHRLATQAMDAADRDELESLKAITVQMQEFIR